MKSRAAQLNNAEHRTTDNTDHHSTNSFCTRSRACGNQHISIWKDTWNSYQINLRVILWIFINDTSEKIVWPPNSIVEVRSEMERGMHRSYTEREQSWKYTQQEFKACDQIQSDKLPLVPAGRNTLQQPSLRRQVISHWKLLWKTLAIITVDLTLLEMPQNGDVFVRI